MYHLFMDLEATDKYSGGRLGDSSTSGITEVAAILFDIDNNLEIDRFHKMCYPKNRKMSDGAIEATGYTDEYLSTFEPEEEVLLEFAAWIGIHNMQGHIKHIVGHNLETYDSYLVNNRMEMFGIKWPLADDRDKIIDTMKHAKGVKSRGIKQLIADTGSKTPTGRVQYTQEAIAKFYGIEYDAHKAINDILALILIFQKMFGLETTKSKRKSLGF